MIGTRYTREQVERILGAVWVAYCAPVMAIGPCCGEQTVLVEKELGLYYRGVRDALQAISTALDAGPEGVTCPASSPYGGDPVPG